MIAMEGLTRISTPLSESWTAWVILSLMVALLIANQRQTGLVRNAWKGLWTMAERTYNDSMDFVQFILLHYFCIATPALALYMCFFPGGEFRAGTFFLTVGLWALVYLVKWGVVYVLRFTFSWEKMLLHAYRPYLESWLVVDMVLWCLLVLMWYIGGSVWSQVVMPVVAVLLAAVLLYRMVRLFFGSPMSVAYILLYFVTLEVLPIVLICLTVRQLA